MIKKGHELEVRVDRAKYPNIGIVDSQDGEIRIKGAVRGQKLKIRINRKRSAYFQAKVLEELEKSPMEIDPVCPHFGICGGCSYQNLSYEDELKYKEEQVSNLFKEAGLDVKVLPVEPSPSHRAYRNKMDYSFGDEYKDGPLSLGMHRKGRFYEIEHVVNCNIADEDFNKILEASLDYFKSKNQAFYNRRIHQGFLRNLIIRKSQSTGDIMVNLVSSSQDKLDRQSFIAMLEALDLSGQISGILHTINDNVADIVKVDSLELLSGRDYIIEELCGLKFKISPFSFFQTNSQAAEKLYGMIRELLGDIDDLTVFDLYSGTGTIAQIMAQSAKEVVAIELVKEAVEMARINAGLNKLDNIDFIGGDMFKLVDKIEKKADLIVIDPPRPGLENTLDKIIAFKPRVFLYVSCNPTTMARDLLAFKEAGYQLGDIHLLDQFPRTPHVEGMVLMTLDK